MTSTLQTRAAPHRAGGLTVAVLAALAALAALWPAGPLSAQTAAPSLTPAAERISDRAIDADQQTYEAMQARLKAINAGGRPLRDYHLAKAQCWLDVSFHEYTRNDRGPFPQAALGEADTLARGLESATGTGPAPLGFDTPLVAGAERLRPDLWARAAGLRSHSGWRCAQHKAACAEVELVHAGHEQLQLQWRHAKPYVQIAEDLLADAQTLAERCDPPPPPVVAAVPVPVVVIPPPPAPPMPQLLSASVVFNFDRHGAADIRPFSATQLDALAARLKADGLQVQQVQLTGHADRLNGTGQADYNLRLSEQRVATVRDALVQRGLDSGKITSQAAGDGQPVQACDGKFSSAAELQECLLPNRRVEVQVTVLPARR